MGYSFDGTNKIISLTAGTVTFDVEDLYSRWADWLVLSDNIKYLPAVRFVGGDAISATKNLGITFFLINGWRIRPQEANHTLRVNGNLYTDPSGFSPFVPTIGAYNVMIEMTVSSLVDSSLAQMAEIEQSAFNNVITLDVVNGIDSSAYPAGTGAVPCKTWANVEAISLVRGIKAVFVRGDWTVGSTNNLTEYHIYGEGATLNATRTKITFTSGNTTTGAHFHDCRIVGPQGGETNYHACIIEGLSNAHCHYSDCGFLTPSTYAYTLQASNTIGLGHITDLHGCYGDEGTVVIDRNATRLNQRWMNYSGNIRFQNQNRSSDSGTVWIHMTGGTVTIDASCTTGSFIISGICTVVNNGTSVVDMSQVVSASGPSGLTEGGIAAAVLALAETTPIYSDVRSMNGATVQGDGTAGNKWRGV